MTFYREDHIRAVRKSRQCNGCASTIEIGSPAVDCAGHYDGDFWAATYHVDCREAEIALNNLHDTHSDEWMNMSEDMEWEDWPWLIDEFPTVAARMNITTERFQKINEEQARVRFAFARREAN